MKLGRHALTAPFEVKSRSTGEVYTLCRTLTPDIGIDGIDVRWEEILPGHKSSAPHFHSTKHEVHIVVRGEVRANVNGTLHELGEGDYIVFKGGEELFHFLENTSDEPVTVLTIASTPENDVVNYAAAACKTFK